MSAYGIQGGPLTRTPERRPRPYPISEQAALKILCSSMAFLRGMEKVVPLRRLAMIRRATSVGQPNCRCSLVTIHDGDT